MKRLLYCIDLFNCFLDGTRGTQTTHNRGTGFPARALGGGDISANPSAGPGDPPLPG